VHGLAALERRRLGALRRRQLAHDLHGREKLVALLDAYVVGADVRWHINKNRQFLAGGLSWIRLLLPAQILSTAVGVR
jgi:hypothetical protein